MNATTAPHTSRSERINARIAPQTAAQIASLKAALGVSISDIVRDSIAMYAAATTQKKPAPGTALKRIIGKYSSGDPDLSVNYKAHVAAYLDKKYPKNYE
jgi:Ribbon-helix-helix protein, copG family